MDDREASIFADAPLECICLNEWVWHHACDLGVDGRNSIGIRETLGLELLEADREVFARVCRGIWQPVQILSLGDKATNLLLQLERGHRVVWLCTNSSS